MTLPFPLDGLRRAPAMFVRSGTINEVVAYLCGYDQARNGGVFIGLREWLVVQLNGCNSRAWTELIPELAARRGLICRASDGTMDLQSSSAIDALFVILEEFFAVRDAPNGPRRIFVEYDRWLRRQNWYSDEAYGFQLSGDQIAGDGAATQF